MNDGDANSKRRKTITEEMRRMPHTEAGIYNNLIIEKLEYMEQDIEKKKERLETLEKKLSTLLEFVKDKMQKKPTESKEIQTDYVEFSESPKKSITQKVLPNPKLNIQPEKKKNLLDDDDSDLSELGSIESTEQDKRHANGDLIIKNQEYGIAVKEVPRSMSSFESSEIIEQKAFDKVNNADPLEELKADKAKYHRFEQLLKLSNIQVPSSPALKKRGSLYVNSMRAETPGIMGSMSPLAQKRRISIMNQSS